MISGILSYDIKIVVSEERTDNGKSEFTVNGSMSVERGREIEAAAARIKSEIVIEVEEVVLSVLRAHSETEASVKSLGAEREAVRRRNQELKEGAVRKRRGHYIAECRIGSAAGNEVFAEIVVRAGVIGILKMRAEVIDLADTSFALHRHGIGKAFPIAGQTVFLVPQIGSSLPQEFAVRYLLNRGGSALAVLLMLCEFSVNLRNGSDGCGGHEVGDSHAVLINADRRSAYFKAVPIPFVNVVFHKNPLLFIEPRFGGLFLYKIAHGCKMLRCGFVHDSRAQLVAGESFAAASVDIDRSALGTADFQPV